VAVADLVLPPAVFGLTHQDTAVPAIGSLDAIEQCAEPAASRRPNELDLESGPISCTCARADGLVVLVVAAKPRDARERLLLRLRGAVEQLIGSVERIPATGVARALW